MLHSFSNKGDGYLPKASLIFDTVGNLYGTTSQGGAYTDGTVFALTPKAGGGWTEAILHNFNNGKNSIGSYASLIFDGAGNLYGTTFGGGAYNNGMVFELTSQADGTWKEKVLHSFNYDRGDGSNPQGGVVFDATGNLYGTTFQGGAQNDGTVFELTPNAAGDWTEKLLHVFEQSGKPMDGLLPYSGLVLDAARNLYGTTAYGGAYGAGTVFMVTP